MLAVTGSVGRVDETSRQGPRRLEADTLHPRLLAVTVDLESPTPTGLCPAATNRLGVGCCQ